MFLKEKKLVNALRREKEREMKREKNEKVTVILEEMTKDSSGLKIEKT